MPSKDAITYRKIHNTGVISARESKHGIESHSDDNLAPVRTLRKRGCPRVQPPKYLNAVHSNDTDNLSHIDMQPITSDTTCADCQAMYGNNEDRSRVPGGEGVKAGDTADIYSCQRCVSGADGQSGVLAAKEPDYEQCDISGDRGCLTWTSGRVDGQLFVQRQTSDTDDAKDVVSGSENTCVDSAGSRDTDDNAVSVNDDHDNAVSVNGDHDNAVSVNGDHDNAVSVDGDHANAVSVNGGGNNSIVSGGGDQDCAVSQGFDNGIIVSGGGDKNQSETDVKLVSETTNGSFLDLSFIDDTGHRPTDTRIAVVVCEMRETTLDPTREAVDGNVHLDGGTETSTDPGHDDTNVTLDDDRFKHDTLMLELLSLVPRDDSYDDSRDDSQSSDDPGWRRPQQLRRRTRAPVRDCGDSDSDDSFLRSYSSHLFQMDDDDDDDDDDVGYRTFGMLHEMADYDDEDDNETSLLSSPEPELLSPFIVGELRHTECCVCLETRSLHVRACCAYAACDDCLARYYTAQVRAACIRVRCIGCDAHVPRDEIIFRLDDDAKRLFDRFLVDANRHPRIKTCPRCSVTTRLDAHAQLGQPEGLRITCTDCLLDWCFPCQAPWHDGATCRQYRKGDKLLKAWARQQQRGQANAQKCPRCKVSSLLADVHDSTHSSVISGNTKSLVKIDPTPANCIVAHVIKIYNVSVCIYLH